MARGFSLVETIFCAFVLSFVFVALFEVIPSALLSIKRSEQATGAAKVMQSDIEQCRSAEFGSLASAPLPDVTLNGTVFHQQLAVAMLAPRLKDVQITVSWTDAGTERAKGRQTTAHLLICQVER